MTAVVPTGVVSLVSNWFRGVTEFHWLQLLYQHNDFLSTTSRCMCLIMEVATIFILRRIFPP